ncbi:hypothetical protein PPMP20_31005 [Paraburkholderia phymatum]|uniref:Uncharacterized protein n=1 Tax=Paraburkholderia phymatum (strain DSM 17167 / CIP 108236 / LMG 21445 / STM815) TaxID=391038 RepID=B2JEX9_PARP8|nr:hypothetical protein [Paraburkholderia phymatum]ACC69908.1 conserved hypothetical protein [Paraburkholderia phymatum STM815]
MSTPPLTLVAGELAMPRLRQLDLVSRSVGREWSLLPPGANFRTELRALYAAMMRTFCMSAAFIRAKSRWDTHAAQPQPAATAPCAPVFKADTISLGMREPVLVSARKGRPTNALAGGAFVIGGAALIAWLMANHPRHASSPDLAAAPEVTRNILSRQDGHAAARAGQAHSRSVGVERFVDAPLAWNRARGDLLARNAEPTPVTSHAIDAHPRVPSTRTKQPATGHPVHARRDGRDARKTNAEKRERDTVAKADVRHAWRATPPLTDIAPHQSLRLPAGSQMASGQPPRHLPSIAGAYSPAAPSARFDSDYGSVAMSAGTHVSDIPPAPIHHDRVDTDSTDWMNHMSHRRITDAPDSFSK